MAHFDDCGAHCKHPYCNHRDFLPFECGACGETFCREHFRVGDHDCPKASVADRRVAVCPFCSKSLPLRDGESADEMFARHEASGECSGASKPGSINAKPPKCPVKGCKERLTSITTYECPKCHKRVCMAHRFEDLHECTSLAKPSAPKPSPAAAAAAAAAAGNRHATTSRTQSCAAAAAAAASRARLSGRAITRFVTKAR